MAISNSLVERKAEKLAMSYTVKEIYSSIQLEGFHHGRPAVFLRFTGCNLWSGLERDRASAICQFCDTDFVGTDGPGGGTFATAGALAERVAHIWNTAKTFEARPFVVCTGGEPLLQLNAALLMALHTVDFEVAVETNGTREPIADIDWLCVSPKAHAPLVATCGDELKLVYPQADAEPEKYAALSFAHFYLQPLYGADTYRHFEAAREYCRVHPQWQLSVQRQKVVGIA